MTTMSGGGSNVKRDRAKRRKKSIKEKIEKMKKKSKEIEKQKKEAFSMGETAQKNVFTKKCYKKSCSTTEQKKTDFEHPSKEKENP